MRFLLSFTLIFVAVLGILLPSAAEAQSSCTLVELYPGYPGYRGMITGLKGIGDFQCLEILERQNPSFDRGAVDGLNVSAARSLGINGTPRDWTWENWMEIEIVRGWMPHCYACLIFDPTAFGVPNGATVAFDDPRMLLGMTSGNFLENYVLNEFGSRSSSTTKEGIYWRVGAAFLHPQQTLNAPQTLDAVRFLVGEWSGHDVDGDGHFSALNMDKVFQTFSVYGGYVPMTGKEDYQDQVYQAIAVDYLMTHSGLPGMFGDALSGIYDDAVAACKLDYNGYVTIGHCVADHVSG